MASLFWASLINCNVDNKSDMSSSFNVCLHYSPQLDQQQKEKSLPNWPPDKALLIQIVTKKLMVTDKASFVPLSWRLKKFFVIWLLNHLARAIKKFQTPLILII